MRAAAGTGARAPRRPPRPRRPRPPRRPCRGSARRARRRARRSTSRRRTPARGSSGRSPRSSTTRRRSTSRGPRHPTAARSAGTGRPPRGSPPGSARSAARTGLAASSTSRASLPGRSESGLPTSPWNCCARRMSQNPFQVSGDPYTSGARNGPARSGIWRYRSAATPRLAPSAARTSFGRRRTPGSTASTNSPIAGTSRSDSAWFATATPNRAAVPTMARSARRRRRRVLRGRAPGADQRLPAQEPERHERHERQVEGVGVRGDGDPPDDRREARTRGPTAPATSGGAPTRRPTKTLVPTASDDEHRGQEVHARRRGGDRREHRRHQEPEHDVRGEPGRVHRAQDRGDRLRLCRCPTRRARGASSPGTRRARSRSPRSRRARSRSAGAAVR